MTKTKEWPTLFQKTATGAIASWTIWTEGPAVITRWGLLGGKMTQSSTTSLAKNVGRANETSPSEQAIREAESKYKKQLRLKYVPSLEETSGVNLKPMLAISLDEKRLEKLEFPVTVQPKYDGCRCMAFTNNGSVRLMSRGGLDYEVPHISSELREKIPDGLFLDGEIYLHGASLQEIRHFIATPTERSLRLEFVCYDIAPLKPSKAPWLKRQRLLEAWFKRHHDLKNVRRSGSVEAKDREHLKLMHDAWVEAGYEGLMVRLHDHPYRLAKRSQGLLKMKSFHDQEFPIVGFGTGKDGVIIYTCTQEQGREFTVRPMGTAEARALMLQDAVAGKVVGERLTVRYMMRSDDNIPIHPRAIGVRPATDS